MESEARFCPLCLHAPSVCILTSYHQKAAIISSLATKAQLLRSRSERNLCLETVSRLLAATQTVRTLN